MAASRMPRSPFVPRELVPRARRLQGRGAPPTAGPNPPEPRTRPLYPPYFAIRENAQSDMGTARSPGPGDEPRSAPAAPAPLPRTDQAPLAGGRAPAGAARDRRSDSD